MYKVGDIVIPSDNSCLRDTGIYVIDKVDEDDEVLPYYVSMRNGSVFYDTDEGRYTSGTWVKKYQIKLLEEMFTQDESVVEADDILI